jgi:hypothetical protein
MLNNLRHSHAAGNTRSALGSARAALRGLTGHVGKGPHTWAPPEDQWLREVMNRDMRRVFASLRPERLDVVELSGGAWQSLPWKSYTRLDYPEFDLCQPADKIDRQYGLVICEQVLEHVIDPLAAVRTLRQLCADDGWVYVSTPFLVCLHDHPGDYWRFTPSGLQLLLNSQGLSPCWVRSWGNRRVVTANFDRWVPYRRWHSLRDEPRLPVVVWALAVRNHERRDPSDAARSGRGDR